MSRRIHSELLNTFIELPERPARVIPLSSGHTEAIWEMGLADRVAAVSCYCSRYVDTGSRPVAGDYLRIDAEKLRALQPDLIIMTAGVQLGVARRLAAAGLPVYVLPLPDSIHGILENIRRLGALLNEMPAAHALVARMEGAITALRATAPERRPRVYAEMWFGRHPRAAGGLTFIHDIIDLAGGENIHAAHPAGYLKLDLPGAAAEHPEAVVVFSEEDDHPVDVPALLRERGWTGAWPHRVIESGIRRGRNLIHDGPSILDTARWLRAQLFA